MALLEVQNLSMRFGGLLAMDDVSFAVPHQKITAVIGPNGAGKTTLFNCITGFYTPTSGRLPFHGSGKTRDLVPMAGDAITRAGIARTFQNIRLFAGMTVLENLLVAQHRPLAKHAGLWGGRRYRAAEQAAVETACRWLEVVGLRAKADHLAGSLPYGEQRKVEIARALCLKPTLLCLDEPAAGLNSKESLDLAELLRHIRDTHGLTLLLIEHDMGVVMRLADQVVVLEYGRCIACGTPETIRSHPEVIRAYLGEEEAA